MFIIYRRFDLIFFTFKFDTEKLGDVEIAEASRRNLEQFLIDLRSTIIRTFDRYNYCLQEYNQVMQKSLDEVEYFEMHRLMRVHQEKKSQAISQV